MTGTRMISDEHLQKSDEHLHKKIDELVEQLYNDTLSESEFLSQFQKILLESNPSQGDLEVSEDIMNAHIDAKRRLNEVITLQANSVSSDTQRNTYSIQYDALRVKYFNDCLSEADYFDQLKQLTIQHSNVERLPNIDEITEKTVKLHTQLKQDEKDRLEKVKQSSEQTKELLRYMDETGQVMQKLRDGQAHIFNQTPSFSSLSQTTFFNPTPHTQVNPVDQEVSCYTNCLAGLLMITGGAMFIAGIITLIWPLIMVGAAVGGFGYYSYEPYSAPAML